MRIVIRGHTLPGRRWCSNDEIYENIHVAVQERKDPVGLVPGDAESATWAVDVVVKTVADGLDFAGPAVHGKRGERFLYLTWGDVGPDGTFHMFRRAKLMLGQIDPLLIARADAGVPLVATVSLTDSCGGPRCAQVKPPALAWAISPKFEAPSS